MSVDIRLPNINAETDSEQLAQVKSYLYQMAQQLNWALNNLEVGTEQKIFVELESKKDDEKSDTSPGSTFNKIKSLIIKSSDIVNAYYEEISTRLEGIYVAESEFGKYTETTSQTINQNSTNIEQLFSHVQNIDSTIAEMNNNKLDINAYINSGLLGYDSDGIPIYGLEIGQRNTVDGVDIFNKYSRFTAGRLSFYDNNDVEVAYISDYKLYITNAEVTGTLTLGSFVFDTSDGIIIRWIGG